MKDRIKALAKERGISVAEVERRSGLSKNTIKKWDRSIPSVDKVASVAKCLGVTIEDLLGGEETC